MKVKTKIIDVNINTPKLSYAKEGDAGIDLTATSKWYDENGNVISERILEQNAPNLYKYLLDL